MGNFWKFMADWKKHSVKFIHPNWRNECILVSVKNFSASWFQWRISLLLTIKKSLMFYAFWFPESIISIFFILFYSPLEFICFIYIQKEYFLEYILSQYILKYIHESRIMEILIRCETHSLLVIKISMLTFIYLLHHRL